MSKTYFLVTNPTQADLDNSVQAANGGTKYIQSTIAKYHILSPIAAYVFSNGVELLTEAIQIDANGLRVGTNEVKIFAQGKLCQDWSILPHDMKHTVRNHERLSGREMVDQLEGSYNGIEDAQAMALLIKVGDVKISLDSGYLGLALYESNLLTVDAVFTQPRKDELIALISAYFVKFPTE